MKKRIRILIGFIALLGLFGLTGCGSKESAHKHEYGKWRVTKAVGCTKDGEQERICSCGEKETKTLPATGHKEVIDEAVEATCTTKGKTEGSHCSGCGEIYKEQEDVPFAHQEKKIKGIAATCTRAGISDGSVCTKCEETVVEQKKIRALGHKYVHGVCKNCKKELPDSAAALYVDYMHEKAPLSFISAKAYPGGSTISFKAYVPKVSGWWTVCWTTDTANASIYQWNKDATTGQKMIAVAGEWSDYTVTLPDDGKNYYFFIAGQRGGFNNQPILVDDVKVLNASGKVIAEETFDSGFEGSMFTTIKTDSSTGRLAVKANVICEKPNIVVDKAVAPTCDKAGKTEGSHCASCGKVIKAQTTIRATGHTWKDGACSVCGKEWDNIVAAINVDQLHENLDQGWMNFITAETYPGGSTISFKAKVPSGVGWWAVSWTTDNTDVSIYKWAKDTTNLTYGKQMPAGVGEWKEYTVTLPDSEEGYYIYFAGQKGGWNGQELLIDEFKVTSSSGKVLAEETFDNGMDSWIFDVEKTNGTTGEAAVSEEIIVDPCKKGHTEVTDAAQEATCTKAGKTEGSHCSVCNTVIKEQTTIPALGHQWNNDTCDRCGKVYENKAASIRIDLLTTHAVDGPMNLMTKDAYPGGSTITFKAYVPKGASWLAIGWTTDLADISNISIYKWSGNNGAYGTQLTSVKEGKWAEYTVTLPENDSDYYIYIVGNGPDWKVEELLLDDFKITSEGNVLAAETFDDEMADWIFNTVATTSAGETVITTVTMEEENDDPCKNGHTEVTDAAEEATCTQEGLTAGSHCSVCNTTIVQQTTIPALGHQWNNNTCTRCGKTYVNQAASININLLTTHAADGPMNLMTRKAYPGGSTITFKAYVPEGAGWLAVGWTTDLTDTNNITVYKWDYDKTTYAYGKQVTELKKGEWAEYTVTLPDGDSNYYIYFAGAVGEWQGDLWLDDFKVTAASGEVSAEENFDSDMASWIFDTVAITTKGETVISTITVGGEITDTDADYHAGIYFEYINESGTMNFITKNAYPGGSTVSFKAYVPKGVEDWWAVSWTTDLTKVGAYKWSSTTANNGKQMTSVMGQWAEYTVTLPEGSDNYYIYIVGRPGTGTPWCGNVLLLDDFKVTSADGNVLAEESFDGAMTDWIFNTVAIKGENTVIAAVPAEEKVNYHAGIYFEYINESGTMNFITKNAYPGGSTVSFKAYVPKGVEDWWAVSWTTDLTKVGAYKWSSTTANNGKQMTSVMGQWAEYTVTLPEGSDNYYIYIVGRPGTGTPWCGNALLMDDFKVTSADGNVLAEESFDGAMTDWIFNTVAIKGENTVIAAVPEEENAE